MNLFLSKLMAYCWSSTKVDEEELELDPLTYRSFGTPTYSLEGSLLDEASQLGCSLVQALTR